MKYPEELLGKLRDDAESRVIGPEDIRLMVFTCNRRGRAGYQGKNKSDKGEHYVHPMLASFWMSDPLVHRLAGVDLMVDSDDINYLWWFFRHTSKVTIHAAEPDLMEGLPTEGQEMKCMGTPHARLTRNYIRTLKYALETDAKGFIICEDDVVFLDCFLDYAMDSINEMRCTSLPKEHNTMALYHRKRYIGAASLYRGAYFCSAGGGFEGLCSVYYDRGVLEGLLQYLEENEKRLPADLLYAEWSDKEWTRYSSNGCLVQHVGGVSAGTSSGSYWTCASFGDPQFCWDPGWKKRDYETFFLRKDK